MQISREKAVRGILNRLLLDGRAKIGQGRSAAMKILEHLGYIQIDTINIVERAHHQTLFSRHGGYSPVYLDRLLSRDRKVFEYWGHAASYLPLSDYRYYLPVMKKMRESPENWYKYLEKKSGHLLKPVLKEIRDNGPKSAREFDPPKRKTKSGWWSWKPVKGALEMLFWRGDLMIAGRRGFERVYDLTERVLPDWVDTKYPDQEEQGRFGVKRALNALAIATEREIVDYIRAFHREPIKRALAEMIASSEVVEMTVKGIDSRYYAFPEVVEPALKLRKRKPKVRLLNPFDHLIINRERTEALFDFDYTIECYTPEAKRRYGYFTFPVLYEEKLVGRIDPIADRRQRLLIIKSLHFEDGFEPDERFAESLRDYLNRFAAFNGCDEVKIEKVVPAKSKRLI